MEFSGVHLNLFNVFKLNIGRFSCKDVYSSLSDSDKITTKKEHIKDLDLTSYESFFPYGNWSIPKGLYIDIYV